MSASRWRLPALAEIASPSAGVAVGASGSGCCAAVASSAPPSLRAVNLETPDVRYARSGDVSIAYQVVGDGPVDLLYVPFLINLVWAWEQPIFVDFCRRAASFSRLILLDK